MGYKCLRAFLFRLNPEIAHRIIIHLLKWIYPSWLVKRIIPQFSHKPVTLFGLTFPNSIGLAAGFDKDGECIDALFGLGFGFVELGAVTPKAQLGNPKPRLFRLPASKALINRMGFNNLGVDHLVEKLKQRKVKGIVGVNIGKNLSTSLENAMWDYCDCLMKLYPHVDYVTINISSPNTPHLRELQTEKYLSGLLKTLKEEQCRLKAGHRRYVPLLLKISPDLPVSDIEVIARTALNYAVDGLVAVNTSQYREGVEGSSGAKEQGGLSGKPIFPLTLKVVRQLHQLVGQKIPIIAVGGIMSAEDAVALFHAGASLIQIYTGLIYEGPGLVRKILSQI